MSRMRAFNTEIDVSPEGTFSAFAIIQRHLPPGAKVQVVGNIVREGTGTRMTMNVELYQLLRTKKDQVAS